MYQHLITSAAQAGRGRRLRPATSRVASSQERPTQPRFARQLGFAIAIFVCGVIAIARSSPVVMADTDTPLPILGNTNALFWGNDATDQLNAGSLATANPLPLNIYGDLGLPFDIDTYNPNIPPVWVASNPCTTAALQNAAMVSAGGDFGMALIDYTPKTGGEVCLWGNDYWGEQAEGDNYALNSTPLIPHNPVNTLFAVPACMPETWGTATAYGYCADSGALLTGVTSISAGANFALALLGHGSTSTGTTGAPWSSSNPCPTARGADCNIPSVTLPPGAVVAWGANYNGQLGGAWSATAAPTGWCRASLHNECSDAPVAVLAGNCPVPSPLASPYLQGVERISAGYNFALAQIGGTVCSWGDNTEGELGLGVPNTASPNACALPGLTYAGTSASTSCATTPQPVRSSPACDNQSTGLLTNVDDIEAGADFGLALLNDGHVCSWGDNTFGELGIGTFAGPQTCTNNVTLVSTNCAWSAREVGIGTCQASGVAYLGQVTQISAGDSFALALSSNPQSGSVCSWGDGVGGALGNNATATSAAPVRVSQAGGGPGYLVGATCVGAGKEHGLAVVNGLAFPPAALVTWGADLGTGQNSGANTTFPNLVPTNLGTPLGGVSSISVGSVSNPVADTGGGGTSGAWNLVTQGPNGCA